MIDPNLICMQCMKELHERNGICRHCGFDNNVWINTAHQLACGSILAGTYLVGRVLGQGGFGITYIGYDLNLDVRVAIKEYYPGRQRDTGYAHAKCGACAFRRPACDV